ncbi:MAG: DEAD/DEAH box helicase [Sphaerochaeta sp.]
MNHWLLDSIADRRGRALKHAEKIQIYKELLRKDISENDSELVDVANALILVTIELSSEPYEDDEEKLAVIRGCASDAFRLLRMASLPEDSIEASYRLLQISTLAVIGDLGADASRLLQHIQWPVLPLLSENWEERTWATICDVWLRLIRKKGWEDRDTVLHRIADLRMSQEQFESAYLSTLNPMDAKGVALELIGLYHLAKAAEIIALFITDGVVEGNHQIGQLLDIHFDRVLAVCNYTQLINLEPIARLIKGAALQMVKNSIWTVTRAVNTRVTQFVKTLVDKGRGDKALFDVLPPQRSTLAEKGLLGSSRRAVVVSLPTSSGKTLIAQFRILQALNQFDHEKGWVAYLAPTKALVNQITRRLRSDFDPLGVVVEKISPALELDSVEMSILQERQDTVEFRVLVTTPEKFDLMLRQGWESKIGRPLTLVVVDEAHTIQDGERGLKLELLLATINNECANAQFLLLTPFVPNAKEVARWLGGTNSDDISFSVDWQPNDRVIGVVKVEQGLPVNERSYDYSLHFETIHTNKKTLNVDELLSVPKNPQIARFYGGIQSLSQVAAMAAQFFQKRGPVIVMHNTIASVWKLAEDLKSCSTKRETLHADVALVQDYLRLEMGEDFPLVTLLEYGIGVHHSGLSDEARALMEWLFEASHLDYLVSTSTIAQGINFPVSGVVMASPYYMNNGHPNLMPPEDFWNIAGRAGRVTQGQLGVVAIASKDENQYQNIKEFIHRQTANLNSALIKLAVEANEELKNLKGIVKRRPEWSSFLQYLSHSYLQMGKPKDFFQQIELILRGTLGFEKLRRDNNNLAQALLLGIEEYTQYLQEPGQPVSLVDSSGFSLQSVKQILAEKESIGAGSWNSKTLYAPNDSTLQDLMGILLNVPELRENLKAVLGGDSPDGNTLALIIKDWVNGVSIPTIATIYFTRNNESAIVAITKCGQNLFSRLTQTASWGLSALLAITGSSIDAETFETLGNLPAMAFYGVNSEEAITFRLLGIPRLAAAPMASYLKNDIDKPFPELRKKLHTMQESDWVRALGDSGKTYHKVWRILEGIND